MVNNMNYKDKLPDFIDGLLDIEEEKLFYSKLGSDDELLMEYKALNSIVNTINSGVNQFAPSEAATKSVFATLGINIPNDNEPKIAKFNLVMPNRAKQKMVKYSLALAASIALMFSVSILNKDSQLLILENANRQLAMADNANSSEKKVILPKIDNKIPNDSKLVLTSNIMSNNVDNINGNNLQSQAKFEENSIVSNIAPSTETQNNDLSANDEYSEITENESNLVLTELDPQELLLSNMRNKSATMNSTVSNYSHLSEEQPIFENLENNENFTIELKNSIYFNPINKEKPNAKFDNIGLTILYQINDNFSAGIDLRDESFHTENNASSSNTLTNASDEINSNKSSIDLTSIGIAVRYNIKEHGDNLFPSGQVILAKNREGLVGRVNVGISYKPFPGLTTTAGIEYSNMTYTSGQSTRNSPKIGLNYGLAYNF